MKTSIKTLAFVLMLLAGTQANAQIGNVLNRVKQKAQNAIEQGTEKAAATTEQVANDTKEAVEEKVTAPQAQVFKPSAEALAADPLAGSETKMSGYSKTIGEIHAAYEHLDPAVYPYQPYYAPAYKNWYFTHDEESKTCHDQAHAQFMIYSNEHIANPLTIGKYYAMTNGKVIPEGEETISAGFAEFRADPLNTMPYTHFIRSKAMLKLFRDKHLLTNLQDGSKDKLKPTEDGTVLTLNETDDARISRWNREEAALDNIAQTESPIGMLIYMADFFKGVVANQIEKGNLYLLSYWEYDACVDHIMKHKAGGSGSEAYIKHHKQLEEWYDTYQSVVSKAHVDAYQQIHNPDTKMANLPKPAHNNTALINEMMQVAKTVYNDGRVPVKVIPKNADWQYERNVLGQIINRNQSAYVIYRMSDNTHYMVDLSFKEMYNGGSYGKLQLLGVGMTNQKVVDYK